MAKATSRRRASVRVGRAGRLVLPVEIRRALDVQVGDRLVLTIDPDDIPGSFRLETVTAAVKRAQETVSQAAAQTHLPASEELIRDRRAAAEHE